MKKSPYIAALFPLLFGLAAAQADPTTYTVTDLGRSFTDATEVDAVAINASGQALLSTTAPDGTQGAFYVWQSGTATSLGQPAFPGDTPGAVVGLSDGGLLAGTSWGVAARAFLGNGSVYTDLGSLGGPSGANAYGIGKTGHVVGSADTGSGFAAFLYKNGTLTALPFLPGGSSGDCGAYGVNASDQVVGYAASALTDADGYAVQHAALWKNGTVQDLGSLAGATGDSFAEAINDAGQIVGASDTGGGNLDAFLVTGGQMQDLGSLGGAFSDAHAINATAKIVGEADTGTTDADGNAITHAFLWQSGIMADLNTLLPANSGWVLTRAVAVNDAGQIVGTGQVTVGGTSYTHAFLLTPSAPPNNNAGGPTLTARAISVGADNITRELLTGSDGSAVLRKIDASGSIVGSVSYGPYQGWTAKTIATGPDGKTRLLWNNADGTATFWLLDAGNAFISQQQYGPYQGWTATAIASETDSSLRALWTHASGQATLWTLDSANHLTTQHVYGPYAGWTAKSLSVGPDGNQHLLWTHTSGQATFWRLNSVSQQLDQQNYGPYAGWTAGSIASASDGTGRVVWVNADAHISLWTINAANTLTGQTQFGPYSGWGYQGIALAPGGNARILWDNVSGQAALWSVAPSGTIVSNYLFDPH